MTRNQASEKQVVFIDMDDTLCDFTGAHRKAVEANPKIQYPQSQFDFFRNLKPLKDAVFAMDYLLNSDKYDPYICTAPSVKNPLCYLEKRLWVEDYLDKAYLERLIICPNKSLVKGHFLIDDCDSGKGQDGFEGELIQFGTERYPDWKAVLKYLKEK